MARDLELDKRDITILLMVMESLSEGKDPTSNVSFENDTILNSDRLKECFIKAAKIFEKLLDNIDYINSLVLRRKKNKKEPFYLTEEERRSIPISIDPIPISKWVYTINDLFKRDGIKKLKATQITSWLCQNDYLDLIAPDEGREYKIATELGQSIGITPINKVNSVGEKYVTNMYNADAQKFLIETVLPLI